MRRVSAAQVREKISSIASWHPRSSPFLTDRERDKFCCITSKQKPSTFKMQVRGLYSTLSLQYKQTFNRFSQQVRIYHRARGLLL